jgi:hypothetical protein
MSLYHYVAGKDEILDGLVALGRRVGHRPPAI